jgi:SAM-dependent methyltransferase
MVNMIHTNSTEHIADQQAVEEFRHQWHVYSKLVDHDFFSHRDVAATLNRRMQKIDRPFRFLDLACGDSRTAVAALRGTAVGSYRGIDLSTPALDLARHAVESLPGSLAFKAQRRFRLRVDGRESLE